MTRSLPGVQLFVQQAVQVGGQLGGGGVAQQQQRPLQGFHPAGLDHHVRVEAAGEDGDVAVRPQQLRLEVGPQSGLLDGVVGADDPPEVRVVFQDGADRVVDVGGPVVAEGHGDEA